MGCEDRGEVRGPGSWHLENSGVVAGMGVLEELRYRPAASVPGEALPAL